MERRASPRTMRGQHAWLVTARLRPGGEVMVIDLSRTGALVETSFRLFPGARVDLQLIGRSERLQARARVLRCHVSALADEGIRYRGGLALDEPIALSGGVGSSGDPLALQEAGKPLTATGSHYPALH